MNIADNIKKLRIKLRLSRKEFADGMGVGYGTVYMWETGKRKPEIQSCRLIIDFCKPKGIAVKLEHLIEL